MDKKLTKLEEKLSPREKAALVLSLESRGEWDEAIRVEKSVPIGLFRITDLDYVDRSYRLTILPYVWGFMRWQQVAKHENMNRWGLLIPAKRQEGAQVIDGLMKGMDRAEGNLVALDEVLEEVCAVHGIDAQAVRRFVGVEAIYKPTGVPAPDPEFAATVRSILSRLAA